MDRTISDMLSKVKSENAKEAIRDLDVIADLIIFHAMIRENAKKMSQVWEDM